MFSDIHGGMIEVRHERQNHKYSGKKYSLVTFGIGRWWIYNIGFRSLR